MRLKKLIEGAKNESIKVSYGGQTHVYNLVRFKGSEREQPIYAGKDGILGKGDKNIPWDEVLRLHKMFA